MTNFISITNSELLLSWVTKAVSMQKPLLFFSDGKSHLYLHALYAASKQKLFSVRLEIIAFGVKKKWKGKLRMFEVRNAVENQNKKLRIFLVKEGIEN